MAIKLKPEKNWKNLYMRSVKLARAKQLGIEYPFGIDARHIEEEVMLATNQTINAHFICSRNQWRSPTAEQVYRKHPKIIAKSAGTSPNAKHTVTVQDLEWADIIFVMEEKHKSRLVAEYRRVIEHKKLYVLDIPDDYKYMDTDLIEQIQSSVGNILNIEH
jgi:predicted protein tyrosine phosphatase